MARLEWDKTGERIYETGIDRGVLYLRDESGEYTRGVAWNGLTAVTEAPEGAEANPQYADNIKYLNLLSSEELKVTIEAFTYPEEFEECDGMITMSGGYKIGQQPRKTFGLSYRTIIGNDVEANDYGYKLHLLYGCLAAPSEKAYATVNDSPEAITFSWEVTTTPVSFAGYGMTSLITIDSMSVGKDGLLNIEEALYGTESQQARLPLPDEIDKLVIKSRAA